MTAPSIKEALDEALEDLQHFSDTQLDRNPKMQKVVATVVAALATLKPDGERREAIARIIDPVAFDSCTPGMYGLKNQKELETLTMVGPARRISRDKADAILASGLVPDEAGIREKIAKEADKKAADLLDAAERLRAYIGATKLAYTEADLHEQAGTVMQAFAAAIRSARDGGAET